MLWVVMRARMVQSNRTVWAWCLLGDGPGFSDVFYSSTNGVDEIDVEEEVELQEFLFAARARNRTS